MRHYETVFLISPNLSEEETETLIQQMEEVVTEKKGKLINKDEWGKRRLAYPIQKFEEAFYVLFHYEGESEIPDELERRFKQSDTILRYLTVKKEMRENIRGRKKQAPVKAEEPPPKEESPPKETPPPIEEPPPKEEPPPPKVAPPPEKEAPPEEPPPRKEDVPLEEEAPVEAVETPVVEQEGKEEE